MKSAVFITSALAIISSFTLADALSKSNPVIAEGEKANSLNTTWVSKTPASSFLKNMETKDLNPVFKVSMNHTPKVSPDGTLIVDNTEQKLVTMNKQRVNKRTHKEFDIETRKRANQDETITTAVYFTQIAGWSRENPKAEAAAYNAGLANGPLTITSNTAGNGRRNTQAANRHPSQEGK